MEKHVQTKTQNQKRTKRIVGDGYEDNPWPDVDINNLRIIHDFLPSPAELAKAMHTTKITIALSDESLEFFKKQAKKYKTPYQAMIRNLLQQYAERAAKQK